MSTGLIIGIVFLILVFIGSGLFYFNEFKQNDSIKKVMFLKKT